MGRANTIYFAYGSNMCPEQMARRCPGGQALAPAELRDWRFLINTRTYATIEARLSMDPEKFTIVYNTSTHFKADGLHLKDAAYEMLNFAMCMMSQSPPKTRLVRD